LGGGGRFDGLIEMLGPELAAQLGYTAAPAVAAAAVPTGFAASGAAGAATLPMASGSMGAAGMGAGAAAGALAAPALLYALISSGVLGFGAGGNLREEMQEESTNLAARQQAGEGPGELGRKILASEFVNPPGTPEGLSAGAIMAAFNQMKQRAGISDPEIGGQFAMAMAKPLANIMASQNRWPTADEIRNAFGTFSTPPGPTSAQAGGTYYRWNDISGWTSEQMDTGR